MSLLVGTPVAMRITRLDADGRPTGPCVAIAGRPMPLLMEQPAGEPVAVEAWTHGQHREWCYELSFRNVDRRVLAVLVGWRTPSPLLARHRRRRGWDRS